jgi:hypothetical protein
LSLVELRATVYELHPATQHLVERSGQLSGHGLNRDRSSELGSQSTEVGPQMVLLSRKVLAAIFNATVALLLVGSQPLPMILSPLTRLSGHSRSPKTKLRSVSH